MTRTIRAAIGSLALSIPALVLAQQTTGYLPDGSLDMTQILPPAPVKGEARYLNDRRIFKDTRHWLGTPRGDLAMRDVALGIPAMADAFSCALGIKLDPKKAPMTMKLIARAGATANAQSKASKEFFKRLRPYQIKMRKTCQAPSELKGSYDYPSGHTTWGWTWALILANLAPDRATPILTRGRAYGESRVVCGVHNYSAIEAGRVTASATYAAELGQPAFQADLAAARAELSALRADPTTPKPEKCDAEAALIALHIL
ncbi:phosphatase PAP2 family protein [Sphingomonas bacterium]|uniref:acid phosphatase n=1 Tax=Sphingomonas bacterium TaxID=1895847 RepID=UPI002628414E|nr:phosphatase PAP2 family protein [Sphingomonas bacterium]MDB5677413.1 phosphatidic acid phosphatase [Sphingomonas bacterium]